MELPADSRSDDISLQVVECLGCGFSALAVYQESRRGALDSEAWEHTCYRVHAQDLQRLLDAIKSCPEPNNPACTCSAHQQLGRQDALGAWNGLEDIQILEGIDIR